MRTGRRVMEGIRRSSEAVHSQAGARLARAEDLLHEVFLRVHVSVRDVRVEEVGVGVSGQHPKGLRTYMGKVGFNYSIIVCARAEKDCPKTFPDVGTRLVWIFDDPAV